MLHFDECCVFISVRWFEHYDHITVNLQCSCINHNSFWGWIWPRGGTVRCTHAYDTQTLFVCSPISCCNHPPTLSPSLCHGSENMSQSALQATHVQPVPACWGDFTATALYSRCVRVWTTGGDYTDMCSVWQVPGENDIYDHWLLGKKKKKKMLREWKDK